MSKITLNTIEEAITDFREGKFVIVVDDEDRENEGDLIIAAEKVTPEKINFMLKNARGVLCAPITVSRCEELDLPHQVTNNTSVLGTPFTVTIDKLEGCSTGVSAADRAATIRALADPASTPETFGRPGHINPLYAQEKGVLRRAGHTEACVDMCRLAGLYPAAALMEIMNDDGTMARLPELREMADEHNIKLISIADLIAYRLKKESIVEKGEEVDMPTLYGHFRLIPFRQKSNGLEHIALIKGDVTTEEPVLVRVHSSCATGDIFGSMRCDCGDQLHEALRMIEKEAVRIGGGMNHRIGLFDMILLKDNHVDFAGGIAKAINRAHAYLKEKGKNLKIEIEVRNFDELEEALQTGGIDRIMLDNFTPENTREAVRRVAGRVELESSGGITFDTLRDYAECGVDYISVGALTHSVKSLDMSFKAC